MTSLKFGTSGLRGPVGELVDLPTRDTLLPILAPHALIKAENGSFSAIAAETRFTIAPSNHLQEVPQNRTLALIARLDAEDSGFRDTACA